MSSAHFLGQSSPFLSTQSVSLPNSNWITYITTPDLATYISIPSGSQKSVFTTPTIPAGYWNFVWTWELQAQNGGNVISYGMSIGNNLTPPTALPIFGNQNPTTDLQYFQTNSSSSSVVNNVISGMIWSDGSSNSQLQLYAGATSSNGEDILFMNWDNASSYPCLSLFKIG